MTPCFPFYRERGESITPSGHSLPQAGTEQSGIPSDERAGSARLFQSIYRREKAPPLAGPWPSPPPAVRAQASRFDVKTPLAGEIPCPLCRLQAVTFWQCCRKVWSEHFDNVVGRYLRAPSLLTILSEAIFWTFGTIAGSPLFCEPGSAMLPNPVYCSLYRKK